MTIDNQERITDLILTEKKISANYDTLASECVNVQLRGEFLELLSQGHQTQTKLFQTARRKGWYQAEQAPASQIDTAYTRFGNQRPQQSQSAEPGRLPAWLFLKLKLVEKCDKLVLLD